MSRCRQEWTIHAALGRIVRGSALLLVLAMPLGAAEGILLVPRFTPGERVRYRMQLTVETESTLNPSGTTLTREEPLRLAFDITWQVEILAPPAAERAAEPPGAVRLRAVIEALQLESSRVTSPSALADDFVGKAVTYRLLPDGSVDSIQAPEEWLEDGQPSAWLRAWLAQGSGVSDGLPRHPVKPGEQWRAEREFEVPGLPRQRLVSESQYLRDESRGKPPCAVILARFELSGADRREVKSPDGTPAQVDTRVEGGGSRLSCYDHRTGRLRESSQTSRESIHLEIRRRPQKPSEASPPLVLESRTVTESHLQVVD